MTSYILDYKANLGVSVIPEGGPEPITPGPVSNNVDVKGNFSVTPVGYVNPLLNIDDTGTITIGDNTANNKVVIKTSVQYQYNSITGSNTNYTLTINDYAVEINSNTYLTVTLPSAAGIGGKKYFIAKGVTANADLVVQAQSGQTIDGNQVIPLDISKTHLEVVSNNVDTWYIV